MNNITIQQNDDDSSVESWSPTIKSRWRFSVEELRVLEATYHHSSNPRQEIINRLAYTLQCPKKTVTTWFQNRRAKLKRQRLLQQEKEQKESSGELQQQQYHSLSSHPEIEGHYQEWLLQEQDWERQYNDVTSYTHFNSNILQREQPLSIINTGGILTSQQQHHYNEEDVTQNYPLQHKERIIGDQKQQQQHEFLQEPTSCLCCPMQNEQQQYNHSYGNMTSGLFPIDYGNSYCMTNSPIPCYSDNYNAEDTYSFLF